MRVRQPSWLVAGSGLLAAATIWAGLQAGLWWLAVPTGFLLAFLLRGRRSLLAAGLAGALGWVLALLLLAAAGNVGRASAVLSGILGVAGFPLFAALLTVLFGALLGLSGGWLGGSLRRLLRPTR